MLTVQGHKSGLWCLGHDHEEMVTWATTRNLRVRVEDLSRHNKSDSSKGQISYLLTMSKEDIMQEEEDV